MSSLGSNVAGAFATRRAGHKAEKDLEEYEQKMDLYIKKFMNAWEGKPPKGYTSADKFGAGGEQRINFFSMGKAGLSTSDWAKLMFMPTKEAQSNYLSKKIGQKVNLKKKLQPYSYASSLVYDTKKSKNEPGTFGFLDELRQAGGEPSMKQQYAPWIKPGQDAYEAMSNAIVKGDMSGFFTSPGYAFRLAEGERAIERLANAGKIPTAQAQKGLIEYGQGVASSEFGNYLQNLSGLSTVGYNAMQDLKSLEAYYKGSEMSLRGGVATNALAEKNYMGQMLISGAKMGGAAIGQGVQMAAGGILGGMGGIGSTAGGAATGSAAGTASSAALNSGFGGVLKGMFNASSY